MMKLIIDIPDKEYNRIKEWEDTITGYQTSLVLYCAVRNGIPLPKGHGRLVDENYVIAELVYRKHLLAEGVKCGEVTEIFDNAAVIDADMGEGGEEND
jgi:hypothetical protein